MGQLLVIPSIDIKDGHTVRVVQGIPELECMQYGNDPVAMAMIWRAENAKCIHVVDFDAAREHSHKNFEIIEEICDSVIIPVQYGGGMHSLHDATQAINLGVYRLIIGSLIRDNEEEFIKILEKFGPQKICAAIDVVDNQVMIHGRKEKAGMTVDEYAKRLVELGVERIVVTDVNRNGMLSGPNLELSNRISKITGKRITLSGGIGDYKDLRYVTDHRNHGVDSVIIGRAMYENRFPCQKIWRVAESGIFS
ncbi:MAG: 1-(5-phosphoribosyl)-5-[(5-phosphoribosylamino)methylideneamino] imidazole-4-carboxamide isomerase [Melioribacteraceae bacterium]|nr:1-(5-phosphoribosyl)-5-[(5-phosphoribosylamino)methylideneamino] imidazole-4-carboxamide isomerase [Melioribacteraceae bacterium]MCF8264556.1 1-(5-phosphoribosyl)-5-[(5-phosphoribosylamino)methylideneamino] imidazole-4-carboxamide isomerase [Melioribacteraceae bacterium]MCF8413750.1 1-(5-phosphoribosyl)-5-[(5-phosphoribosylamino)methylideneamino] imidazole-4-carboxamide isomerase [Melioribacteraceae bacterium]